MIKYTRPLVSVVIFNFNGLRDTRRCLKSLRSTKYPNFKVLVIDDGSKIDEMAILRKEFKVKNMTFVSDGENKGFSMRANQALRDAKGKYVMLLNNDTEVKSTWLDPLVSLAESDPKVAICQSKLRWLTYPKYFEYSGACGGYLDRIGHSYARGRILFSLEQDLGQYEDTTEIFWSSGAAMFIRKSIVAKVGWFDEDLHSYQEEVDFCWRVKKLGLKLMIVPKSVVYHKGSSSWGKLLSRKIYLVHRNSLILLIKHLSVGELLWIFPLRIILDYAIVLFYISEGRLNYTLAVIRAHLDAILSFSYWFSKRSQGLHLKGEPLSIIFAYYFHGSKTYGQLKNKSYQPAPIVGYQKLFRQQNAQ